MSLWKKLFSGGGGRSGADDAETVRARLLELRELAESNPTKAVQELHRECGRVGAALCAGGALHDDFLATVAAIHRARGEGWPGDPLPALYTAGWSDLGLGTLADACRLAESITEPQILFVMDLPASRPPPRNALDEVEARYLMAREPGVVQVVLGGEGHSLLRREFLLEARTRGLPLDTEEVPQELHDFATRTGRRSVFVG